MARSTEELVGFVRRMYGPAMAGSMARLFLERPPRDAVESGFQRSVRRSLEREMDAWESAHPERLTEAVSKPKDF